MPNTPRSSTWTHRFAVLPMALALVGLSGCGAASPATGSGAATAQTSAPAALPAITAAPAAAATQTGSVVGKPTGKLSALLVRLADPALSLASAEAQAAALGLPATGAGSIPRDETGAVQVAVRMSSIAEADQQTLRDLGATIINVSESYSTITIYIQPTRLNDLAALPTVENIREELRS